MVCDKSLLSQTAIGCQFLIFSQWIDSMMNVPKCKHLKGIFLGAPRSRYRNPLLVYEFILKFSLSHCISWRYPPLIISASTFTYVKLLDVFLRMPKDQLVTFLRIFILKSICSEHEIFWCRVSKKSNHFALIWTDKLRIVIFFLKSWVFL